MLGSWDRMHLMVDRHIALSTAAGLLTLASARAQTPAPFIKELGTVDFARDLDAVLAKKPSKPLFLLFQEIPG